MVIDLMRDVVPRALARLPEGLTADVVREFVRRRGGRLRQLVRTMATARYTPGAAVPVADLYEGMLVRLADGREAVVFGDAQTVGSDAARGAYVIVRFADGRAEQLSAPTTVTFLAYRPDLL